MNWGYALRTAAYTPLTKRSFHQAHWELQKIYNVTLKIPSNIFNPFLRCGYNSKLKSWLSLQFSKIFRKQNQLIVRDNKCVRLNEWHLLPPWNTHIVASSTEKDYQSWNKYILFQRKDLCFGIFHRRLWHIICRCWCCNMFLIFFNRHYNPWLYGSFILFEYSLFT